MKTTSPSLFTVIFKQVYHNPIDFDLQRSPSPLNSSIIFRPAECLANSADSRWSDHTAMLPDSADARRQCAQRILKRSLSTLGPRPPASVLPALKALSTIPEKIDDGNTEIYHRHLSAFNLNDVLPCAKRQTF